MRSKHFEDEEFACKCGCGFCEPDDRLIETLDVIREAIGKPVNITSGCRCTYHNKRVGGVTGKRTVPAKGAHGGKKDSNHTHGTAADIQCNGLPASELWSMIKQLWGLGRLPHIAGLGRYDTFVHVDVDPKVRGRLREWDERTRK